MGVKVRVTRVALNTATGTQDITISGLGPAEEIKAAMFFVSGATVDNTQTTHLITSYGFTDGTNQRAVGHASEDGVGTSDTKRVGAADEVIQMINPTSGGAGSIDMEANFVSFIMNGVQINIGVAGAAYLCTVIFWVGTSILAQVGEAIFPKNTSQSRVTVSVPFEPNLLFGISSGIEAFGGAPTPDIFPSVGFWSKDDPTGEGSLAGSDEDAQGTTDTSSVQTNRFLVRTALGSGVSQPRVDVGVVTSSTITFGTGNGQNVLEDTAIAYLAIYYDDVLQSAIDSDTTAPSATGDFDVTTGFTPQFVMQLTGNEENLGCGFSIGAFDATNEFCVGFDSEEAVTTSNTNCRADSKAVKVVDAGDTVRFEGTFSSFLATAFRVNYTTVVTTTTDLVWIAIEEAPALQYEQENFRWRDDDGSESAATFLAGEEVNITRAKSTNTRLRTTIDSTGADPATATATLQYIQKGDNPSEWRDVPLT